MNLNPKKYFNYAITLLLLSALIVQIFPPVMAQTNTSNIRIQLNGSSVLGILSQNEYSATLIDPENRDWNYEIYVTATNDSGASPLKELPLNGTTDAGNYTIMFNITAMAQAGELEIHINITSGNLYYEKVQPIIVVTPIVFNVDINNPTNVIINNATVQFFVDDEIIDTQIINTIYARQETTVSTEWVVAEKEPGWHNSTILVDLNGDGIIDQNVGDMKIEELFLIEGGSDWIFAITVLIGLFALVIGLGLITRRKVR